MGQEHPRFGRAGQGGGQVCEWAQSCRSLSTASSGCHAQLVCYAARRGMHLTLLWSRYQGWVGRMGHSRGLVLPVQHHAV